MENPNYTGPPKDLQDLTFFNIRLPIERLPTGFFLQDRKNTTISIFIGPPLFLPAEDRGLVDFPMSVFIPSQLMCWPTWFWLRLSSIHSSPSKPAGTSESLFCERSMQSNCFKPQSCVGNVFRALLANVMSRKTRSWLKDAGSDAKRLLFKMRLSNFFSFPMSSGRWPGT